jgi:hypothetical protein
MSGVTRGCSASTSAGMRMIADVITGMRTGCDMRAAVARVDGSFADVYAWLSQALQTSDSDVIADLKSDAELCFVVFWHAVRNGDSRIVLLLLLHGVASGPGLLARSMARAPAAVRRHLPFLVQLKEHLCFKDPKSVREAVRSATAAGAFCRWTWMELHENGLIACQAAPHRPWPWQW